MFHRRKLFYDRVCSSMDPSGNAFGGLNLILRSAGTKLDEHLSGWERENSETPTLACMAVAAFNWMDISCG